MDYLIRTLTETSHLVKRNRLPHARFTLAVLQDLLITDAILLVLNDEMHLGSTHQEFASEAKDNVVGILVFVQLITVVSTDGSRIGSTMSTNQVEASALELTGSDGISSQCLTEQRLLTRSLFLFLCRNGGYEHRDTKTQSKNSP